MLGRGYALARRATDGQIVRAAADVALGDRIELRLASGQIGAEVTQLEPDEGAG